MKKQHNNAFRIAVFSIAIFLASITSAYANIVTYTLDNVVTETNKIMTGTFEWDYTSDTGGFTELFIQGYGTNISGLSINIDVTKSIEFSLLNFPGHNQGVDITLVFDPLSTTQSTPIDLVNSVYAVGANGDKEKFISGNISPMVVPVPAAFYLFGSGLLGFLGIAKRNKV